MARSEGTSRGGAGYNESMADEDTGTLGLERKRRTPVTGINSCMVFDKPMHDKSQTDSLTNNHEIYLVSSFLTRPTATRHTAA